MYAGQVNLWQPFQWAVATGRAAVHVTPDGTICLSQWTGRVTNKEQNSIDRGTAVELGTKTGPVSTMPRG